MTNDPAQELKEATERVLASTSRKKLVVAGPGAGKTTLFRKLLDGAKGSAEQRLVLTFINNLKADLDRSLGDAAQVFTLHGYCQHLLRRHEPVRNGLSSDFRCYPGLVSLIKKDWQWLQKSDAPRFVELMRDLGCSKDQKEFYFVRANYYDAVDFDDSVYRTHEQLAADSSLVPAYELVLIDEFQDFNKMEAAAIDLLAGPNSIVIAGDDDQALYSQLRGASWDHIRSRYTAGKYEIFELPFCMRCPEVIVGAVNDMIAKARVDKKLGGRIDKPYRYFEPVKGEDSRLHPKIDLVETSVQRNNANYFGRYIEQCIKAISENEVKLAKEKHEPVALIIGSNPYRRQVEEYLIEAELLARSEDDDVSRRDQALQTLSEDARSNLGWRIILAEGDEKLAHDSVIAAAEKGCSLVEVLPAELRDAVLKEVEQWLAKGGVQGSGDESADTPAVMVTSFEGAKGLSAQYVFLVGIQSGDIPRDARDVKDIEICRFLVGMTRTKKKCSVLVTKRFGQDFKQRSEFLGWIKTERFAEVLVNAAYWKKA